MEGHDGDGRCAPAIARLERHGHKGDGAHSIAERAREDRGERRAVRDAVERETRRDAKAFVHRCQHRLHEVDVRVGMPGADKVPMRRLADRVGREHDGVVSVRDRRPSRRGQLLGAVRAESMQCDDEWTRGRAVITLGHVFDPRTADRRDRDRARRLPGRGGATSRARRRGRRGDRRSARRGRRGHRSPVRAAGDGEYRHHHNAHEPSHQALIGWLGERIKDSTRLGFDA